ncbi:alpha/beta hydrolase [Sphingomonas sp. AR_OL41]|jgi:dienelactone hydrolase|uniref:alpha/beta hydrolase n=1 Tax=Sphingomonas sp. AR_OL41 TaxID=3042729 RepID=UPI002480C812|nr:alpha/beta hydrolase [Sphingomonas sp. AR_OL41]MDH7974550.1 alpha/beta hydrolase [Sphingomonas sp. AR_OL41]
MRVAPLICALLLAGCGQSPAGKTAAPTGAAASATAAVAVPVAMTFRAGDGLTVFARRYDAQKPKALILLFHQAGSSKDEYATIAPQLAAAGYSALAVDARAGGKLYGVNETAAALTRTPDYLEAQQDLQAALNWAQSQKLPIILWGSSYSSSLVFPLAAANPGVVQAILAFSPGEYFADKQMVEQAAADVTVPVFVTSASKPDEIAAAKAIAGAVPGGKAQQYVPSVGVHGSSTLIAEKNPKGAEANWRAVMAFLDKVVR